MEAQVDPVWDGTTPSSSKFTLHFVAEVSGLGLATYFVRPSRHSTLAKVLEYADSTGSKSTIVSDWQYERKSLNVDTPIVVENSQYRVI